MYDSSSDRTLVECALQGDSEAAGALVERYYQRTFRFIWRQSGDRDAAEDIVQSAFARALSKLERLKHPDLFWPWLRRIALNTLVDDLRIRASQKDAVLSDDLAEHCVADGPDPAAVAILDDMSSRLREHAIPSLSENYKNVIRLLYFEGLSYPEIARELDVPEGTVAGWLSRARTALRKRLSEE